MLLKNVIVKLLLLLLLVAPSISNAGLTSVNPPYPIFTKKNGGQPLDNGQIHIGTAGQEARVTPISVFWDTSLTIPAAQPISTIGGYPSFFGSPGRLYVNSDFSITVLDSGGAIQYTALNATDFFTGVAISGIAASDITYQSSETDSVETTVQAWLDQDVINGKTDYSLVGDGVTNETTQLTKAIAACGDRVLYLPTGTYNYDATFAVPTGCRIIGEGMQSTVLHQLTANATTFVPENDNEFAYLKFTGAGAFVVGGRGCIDGDPSALGLTGKRVYIHHCMIGDTISTSGFTGDNCDQWWVYKNLIEAGDQFEHGIYLSASSTQSWVLDNRILRTEVPAAALVSTRGVQLKGASSVFVLNNFISGPWNGYGIIHSDDSGSDVMIRGNRIHDINPTSATAISVGNGAAVDDNFIISDNKISEGANTGINILGCSGCEVSNNEVRDVTTAGISANGTGVDMSELVIKGNVVTDCATGVRVISADAKTFVINNTTMDNSGAGITYEAGSTIGGVFGNVGSGNGVKDNIAVVVPSDIGTLFTVTYSGRTDVVGGGSITETQHYVQNGNKIDAWYRIVAAGGATTQSVDGTTKVDLPRNIVGKGYQGTVHAFKNNGTTPSTDHFGHGMINEAENLAYLPAWAATSDEIVIHITYMFDGTL